MSEIHELGGPECLGALHITSGDMQVLMKPQPSVTRNRGENNWLCSLDGNVFSSTSATIMQQ